MGQHEGAEIHDTALQAVSCILSFQADSFHFKLISFQTDSFTISCINSHRSEPFWRKYLSLYNLIAVWWLILFRKLFPETKTWYKRCYKMWKLCTLTAGWFQRMSASTGVRIGSALVDFEQLWSAWICFICWRHLPLVLHHPDVWTLCVWLQVWAWWARSIFPPRALQEHGHNFLGWRRLVLFIVYILPKYRNSAQVGVLLLGPLKETTWGNYGKKLPLHGNSPTACTLHGSLKIAIFFSAENLKLRKQSAN